MLPFHDAVADDFAAVNKLIIDQLESRVELVENIGHYIVEAGGKRLRPLVVLLVARALADDKHGEDAITMAAIIEFIHTATLLHDDVVDISELRRNRQTANTLWGNAPSVLVGDFLYSRAFQLMVALGSMPVMDIMSLTTNIIAEGEVLQLVNAGNPETTEDSYMDVIHYKTAMLFEAAAQTAGVVANASEEQCQNMKTFGYHLGMAFQLVDDALDYTGDPEKTGKNIGDDLSEGKPTLPLIHTMKHGKPEQQELVRNAIKNRSADQLAKITEAVSEAGGLAYTLEIAKQHAGKAESALDYLPASRYKTALGQLTRFSLERQY
jgi:octaprenyl-diphosphate synthase